MVDLEPPEERARPSTVWLAIGALITANILALFLCIHLCRKRYAAAAVAEQAAPAPRAVPERTARWVGRVEVPEAVSNELRAFWEAEDGVAEHRRQRRESADVENENEPPAAAA